MPTLRGSLPEYPWDSLKPYVEMAQANPKGHVDLSIGSPVDPTPRVIREALTAATDSHAYPATAGSREVRAAIVDWLRRRRGVRVDVTGVLPTVGSKELVALLPFLLGIGPGEAVVHPRIAYPSYAMGAELVGAEAVAADDPAEWPEHTRLVWLNSPSNPDGRVLSVDQLRVAVARARELGAVIVSDECYAEFGWESPWDAEGVPSILDPRVLPREPGALGDAPHPHGGVLMAYSLSKQSNLAGYRAAFVAGDPSLIAELTKVRKHAGLMLPGPMQAAMVAALGDEVHVEKQKDRYRARRAALLPAVEAAGYRVDDSEAGLYLWVTPAGAASNADAWETVEFFAKLGIIVGPGHFYGDHSRGHVRLALTASDETIAEAARRLNNSAE